MAQRLYYGNAYYPEAWERWRIKQDIDKMQEIGFNTVRIAEFAWAEMEKSEGNYDFSLFREVVDYCKEKGMYVLMCTPTACPPAWLVQKDPTVLLLNAKGRRLTHGARRNTCHTNKNYLDACDKIVEAMAKEFGGDENVIGWQIDNELYIDHGGMGCTCPSCQKGYREFLRKKYGTIERLNDEWDCHVWSMRFDAFEQVCNPSADIWNHPSVKTMWSEYQNELITGFVHRQIDILKKFVRVPVSTDMMPLLGLSYDDIGQKTDVVQYNHYNDEKDLWMHGMWCDYMRSQKDKAFWITETSPNWNGSEYANYTRPMNFSVANTMLSFVLGAEMNCYWLWKKHYGGHEIMHGSVVDSYDRECHNIGEIRRMAKDIKIIEPVFVNSPVRKSKVAVHFTHSAWQIFSAQPIVPSFNYQRAMEWWIYRPMARRQIRADFIGASHSLDGYKLLISPFTACLDEYGLADRILEFVKQGGTWFVFPMTDVRTECGARYRNAPFAHLEDWADVRLKYMLPRGEEYDMHLADGDVLKTEDYIYYAFETGERSEAVGYYKDGYLKDEIAVTKTKVGDGYIVIMGAVPVCDDLGSTLEKVVKGLGIELDQASENVVTSRRTGENEVFSAIEVENKEGSAVIPYDGVDLISGAQYTKGQTVSLEKYGYLFVKKENENE